LGRTHHKDSAGAFVSQPPNREDIPPPAGEPQTVEFGSRAASTAGLTNGGECGNDRVRVANVLRRVTATVLLLGWPMDKLGLAMILLTILLAGCGGSLRGDASAGPNPGGGFYGAPNIDVGRINP
jgi:hypothetical protein